jgi:hypothetical protein
MSREQDLIDTCAAYCTLMGLTPLKESLKEDWWLMRAVGDYRGGFQRLNDRQRRLIAGLQRGSD